MRRRKSGQMIDISVDLSRSLFIDAVYRGYGLYLALYLYPQLTQQVQPCTRARRSGNVSP